MKLIEFGEHSFPFQIEVKREEKDNNEPLALSEVAINRFIADMEEALKQALLQAFEQKKLLPRGIKLQGTFSIVGTRMNTKPRG